MAATHGNARKHDVFEAEVAATRENTVFLRPEWLSRPKTYENTVFLQAEVAATRKNTVFLRPKWLPRPNTLENTMFLRPKWLPRTKTRCF